MFCWLFNVWLQNVFEFLTDQLANLLMLLRIVESQYQPRYQNRSKHKYNEKKLCDEHEYNIGRMQL
jgi:hypothetical protein